MVLAADLSARTGRIGWDEASRIRALVAAAGLPCLPPEDLGVEAFLGHMAVDKKVVDGRLRLILLEALGHAVVTDDVDEASLRRTLIAGNALCRGEQDERRQPPPS
jgi:3-dehydroquinate synthase